MFQVNNLKLCLTINTLSTHIDSQKRKFKLFRRYVEIISAQSILSYIGYLVEKFHMGIPYKINHNETICLWIFLHVKLFFLTIILSFLTYPERCFSTQYFKKVPKMEKNPQKEVSFAYPLLSRVFFPIQCLNNHSFYSLTYVSSLYLKSTNTFCLHFYIKQSPSLKILLMYCHCEC